MKLLNGGMKMDMRYSILGEAMNLKMILCTNLKSRFLSQKIMTFILVKKSIILRLYNYLTAIVNKIKPNKSTFFPEYENSIKKNNDFKFIKIEGVHYEK